jgi:hypothetical protein
MKTINVMVNGSKVWPNDPMKKDKRTKRLTDRRDFKQQGSNDISLYAAKSLLNNFILTSYSKKGYGYDNSCLLNNVLIFSSAMTKLPLLVNFIIPRGFPYSHYCSKLSLFIPRLKASGSPSLFSLTSDIDNRMWIGRLLIAAQRRLSLFRTKPP